MIISIISDLTHEELWAVLFTLNFFPSRQDTQGLSLMPVQLKNDLAGVKETVHGLGRKIVWSWRGRS